MEDVSFNRELVIEEARLLREWIADERVETNTQKGIDDIDREKIASRITVKYLGDMEFVEDGKTVKRNVFEVAEDGQNVVIDYVYGWGGELFTPLGLKRATDKNIILAQGLSSKPVKEQEKIRQNLESKDRSKAKTLEQLEEEHKEDQKAKEDKVTEELAQSTGNPKLKIRSYRRIIDQPFLRQFPETCEGASEIGMAELEDGTYMMVADYGEGFEMAKGTEPAKPTMQQVYNIDKEKASVEQTSPTAIMRINGNGNAEGAMRISITKGQYGYTQTSVVRRVDDRNIGTGLAEQGEGRNNEKSLQEQQEEAAAGVDYARNLADLVTGEDNIDNDRMKQQIVEDVIKSHQEQLEGLYGDDVSAQADAIMRYIETAIKNANIIPENIRKFVEDNIEADYGRFFKDRTQH